MPRRLTWVDVLLAKINRWFNINRDIRYSTPARIVRGIGVALVCVMLTYYFFFIPHTIV